jgi:hypothetical protein
MKEKLSGRLIVWSCAAALSAGAFSLSSENAAADWRYNYTSNPAIAQPNGLDSFGDCLFSMPNNIQHSAIVGVHPNHGWVALNSQWSTEEVIYGQSLGYCPEASVYQACKNSGGATAWFGSQYYDLWRTYHSGNSRGPDFPCPGSHPYIVGAYCSTRAWW